MKIPAHQLEAFYATATLKSFSRAADQLAVTQSALSQRVANLEKDLEVTLIIRDPSGLKLTSAGEKLLRFCQTQQSLETELLGQLRSKTNELVGVMRIAGFSSVLRSVIIPSLAGFLRENPGVQCEFRSYEVIDLLRVLQNAEADIVILDYLPEKKDIVQKVIGYEEYVVIESAKYKSPEDVYLDHGPHDNATESFFTTQKNAPKTYRRSFMGDVYGIIDGVSQGFGRAVMSKHLVKHDKLVKIRKGHEKYQRPVTLCYYQQPYYSRLQEKLCDELALRAQDLL